MKALDEYFLVVVFTLLLNRVHVLAIFVFNFDRERWQQKGNSTSLLPTWNAMRQRAPAAKLSAREHRIMSFRN